MNYKIKYISQPIESNVFQPLEDGKKNFFDKNTSLNICACMILGRNEGGDFHHLLYGRYLAGFAFEGYNLLPPLCVLQTVYKSTANNVVCFNDTIYDPINGVFTVSEYKNKDIAALNYTQIYIPEAYEETEWRPFIPDEIQTVFENDTQLGIFFSTISPMQQSKILNYIYPFSKPSSFKENRIFTKPITPTGVQHIISHIRSFMPASASDKSAWEELKIFETAQAVETLKKCGITENMTVLDMGCGHGHYTYAASITVGVNGKVIAVDSEIEGKVLRNVENKAAEYSLGNITCLKTNENGLSEYKNNVDFIILYDVLHGLFNYTKADWGKTTRLDMIEKLASLLKINGILSLALYSEIEHEKIPMKTKDGKESFKISPLSHNEAIKPYIELIQASGLKLVNVIENGGVHFDDFHNPAKWRKYGEIKISSLERRNIYNFIKI
jgi:tRNA(1-methyladenosine) methyltransferase and related methyltransferases